LAQFQSFNAYTTIAGQFATEAKSKELEEFGLVNAVKEPRHQKEDFQKIKLTPTIR